VVKLFWSCDIAVLILESSSHIMSKRIAMWITSKWSLIHKTFQKKRVVCAGEKLQALELETLFKTLVQSRVSLNTPSLDRCPPFRGSADLRCYMLPQQQAADPCPVDLAMYS
jgi:hypothetical protein